jgi:hypothetical protein
MESGFFYAAGKTFCYPCRTFHMFKKLCLLIWVLIGCVYNVEAQITKEFIVKETEGFNLVKFDFSSYKGNSLIRKNTFGQPIRVHAHLATVNILPTFSHTIAGGVLNAHIEHQNTASESLGKSLSYRLITGSNESYDHDWFIDLNSSFLYDLNFDFGLGKASFDLSYLPISKCKIKTASADVALDYSGRFLNVAPMDTMMVVIKMGSLDAQRINYSNAKHMLFDVHYGSVNLSFEENVPGGSTVSTMVGAGSVNISLPSTHLPYIVKVKSTAMCRTSVPKHLREIDNKVYVSKGYKKNAEDLMTFLIDISVGAVSLK